MKQTIQKFLIAVQQRVQLMRKGKNHMKVRRVDDFSPAFVYPDFFLNGLTVRTAAVAAGIAVKDRVAAFCTSGKVKTERTGFTAEDCPGSFFLFIGLKMLFSAVIRVRNLPDLLDQKATHQTALP